MGRNFHQLLDGRWAEGKLVCVWLNPNPKKIPKSLREGMFAEHLGDENVSVVLETCDFACAYRLNSACYEAYGIEGIQALHETVEYLHKHFPEIPVILDAERSGSRFSNLAYAKFAFDILEADAITVHPFRHADAFSPFLDRKDKGVMALCRSIPDVRVVLHTQNGGLVLQACESRALAPFREVVGALPILITDIEIREFDVRSMMNVGRNLAGTGLMFAPAPDATPRDTQRLHNHIKGVLGS